MSDNGWNGLIAHARAERDAFKKRSTAKRKEWQELKRQRRWLDALEAMSRMHEYAASARDRQAFIDANKHRI